ncbi:MAG: cytochrome c biogenesis protein ResB [Bacteroidales bacterium]|nr:cytochrome c biogenesis protein ResB [Bacteroidales bacterium]
MKTRLDTNKNYRQSFLIVIALALIGFFVEFITPENGIKIPGWPINVVILAVFIIYILALHFLWKSKLIKMLSSVPFTIGAISTYSVLVLLMGFIPQSNELSGNFIQNIGLTHIHKSWPFLFVSIYMLIILGLVILRRFKKLNFRNIAFFINHAGIWLVIATASLGTGDLQRVSLPLYIGENSSLAFQNDSTLVELPFNIKLNDFTIEEFSPQVIIFDPRTKEILNEANVDYFVEKNKIINYNDIEIKISEYLTHAKIQGDKFIPKDTVGSEHAVLVSVNSPSVNISGWISSGSYIEPSTALIINNEIAVSLSMPEEKKYTSNVDIISDSQTYKDINIEVNSPYKIKGYKIYQQSFDDTKGKWSKISILELVKDPWLPVVYIGLFMLVIGSFMLFWLGKKH